MSEGGVVLGKEVEQLLGSERSSNDQWKDVWMEDMIDFASFRSATRHTLNALQAQILGLVERVILECISGGWYIGLYGILCRHLISGDHPGNVRTIKLQWTFWPIVFRVVGRPVLICI